MTTTIAVRLYAHRAPRGRAVAFACGYLISAAVGSAAGCSPRTPESLPSSRIVTHGFVLDSVALVDPPRNEEDTLGHLGFVGGGTRLSNGSIVMLDRRASALIAFDSLGRYVRRIGRPGNGPGEFAIPEWIGQCTRDTLYVWDGGHRLLIRFDSSGRHIDQRRLLTVPWRLGCTADQRLAILTLPEGLGVSSAKSRLYYSELLQWSLKTDSVERIDSVPAFRNRPLSPMTSLTVTMDRIYVGTADSGMVMVYDWTGRQLSSVSFGATSHGVTRANYEAAVAQQVATLDLKADRDFFTKFLLDIPPPDRVPAYRTLIADPAGDLWVVTSALGDARTEVAVVHPSGEITGSIVLPYELELLEVGSGYFLGHYEDARGAPRIAVYRYQRR